ncbi:MAG: helix-turn-helix domain-containing protein [Muribaculaceae bacterium]|nr:helix-turn-helix transcriptional regulator [Bacteroides sp.]MDE6842394.1 helix-turn-helix domain-containing protein [Muribaculaceae bacterium]
MEDTVATRLKYFISKERLNSSQFADACGIPRPTLSQLLTGRNKKISDQLIGQIHAAFPQLSVLWLLFGEGEMYNVAGGSSSISAGAFGATEGPSIDVELQDGSLNSDIKVSSSEGMGLNGAPASSSYNASAAILAADYKNLALMKQIEAMKQNARRVVQITIYYDDSTFETFSPAK